MAETAERPKSFTDTAKDIAQRIFRQENVVLIILLVALTGVLSVITKGATTKTGNLMNILLQSSMRGVAAMGQALVILTAGIDVSVGGAGLVCARLGTSLMTLNPELSIINSPVPVSVGILVMLLAGAGWGLINGLSVSRIGMPALIVTLAMWEITKGVAFQIKAGQSIAAQPDGLAFFGQGNVAGVPVPVIIFIGFAAVTYFVMQYTTFGRSVYAVGGNPTSAWLSGINVKNILLSVFVISGLCAGVAGVIMTSRLMSSSMQTLDGLEIDSIAAATVGGISLFGGKGNIIGVVIAVIIIGVVNNGMSILNTPAAMQSLVKGAIIFSAVAIDYIRRR